MSWIRCADRLPEESINVLGFWPEGEAEQVWPTYHDGVNWCDPDGSSFDLADAPTHWMPFPPYPTEDAQ